MAHYDGPATLRRLATDEREHWNELESAFAAVQVALDADEPVERLAHLLLAVSDARQRWAAASRAKQEFADAAVLQFTVAVSTRSPMLRAKR